MAITEGVKDTKWFTHEYIKCANDPIYCAANYAKVLDKGSGMKIPFELFDTQKRVINTYLKNDYSLVLKYRQGGISTTTAWYLAWRLCFTPGFKVAVVANKLGTAKDEIFKKIVEFIDMLPEWMRVIPAKKDKEDHKIYENGSEVKALAAGKQGLRGYSPDIIFLDEAAFFEFGHSFYTAARGSLSAGGGVIMVSTPNGMDELYYKTYQNSVDGVNDYAVVEIKWYEDPRFNAGLTWELKDDEGNIVDRVESVDPKVYKPLIQKQYKPTCPWFVNICKGYDNDKRRISAEVENSFLGSGGNFVAKEDIERQETANIREPVSKELDGQVWVWEEPIPGQKYILGADVSLGSSEDFSTINILKVSLNGFEQVLEFSGKVHPDVLGTYVYEYGMRYNALAVVDITGGAGISTISTLFQMGYPPNLLYYDTLRSPDVKARMQEFENGEGKFPGFTIGVNRTMMLNEFEKLVRENDLIIRSMRVIGELKTFVIKENGKVEHKRGFHDDLIFSLCMPLFAYKFASGQLMETPERTRKIYEVFRNVGQQASKGLQGNSTMSRFGNALKKMNVANNGGAEVYKTNGWLFGGKKGGA